MDAMVGVSRSSAKMKMLGAEVARVMRSAAARGEVADLERARKGCLGEAVLAKANLGLFCKARHLPRERLKLWFAP